jgi:hypothetical protein
MALDRQCFAASGDGLCEHVDDIPACGVVGERFAVAGGDDPLKLAAASSRALRWRNKRCCTGDTLELQQIRLESSLLLAQSGWGRVPKRPVILAH